MLYFSYYLDSEGGFVTLLQIAILNYTAIYSSSINFDIVKADGVIAMFYKSQISGINAFGGE